MISFHRIVLAPCPEDMGLPSASTNCTMGTPDTILKPGSEAPSSFITPGKVAPYFSRKAAAFSGLWSKPTRISSALPLAFISS